MTRSNVGSFFAGVVFTLAGLSGAAKVKDLEAEVDRLGHQVDTLNVGLQMMRPGSSHVDEPGLHPSHRHDTAGEGAGGPDTVTRRDTFDRRPSGEGGGR